MPTVTIQSRKIGIDYSPFIIAEMSGNHNQSLKKALAIVEAASMAGAHALKLQTYTAETMTIDSHKDEFTIDDPQSQWHGRSLYGLYKCAHTPWEWHKTIFERGRQLGLIVFSTPFDETAVDFLETLEVPCYKIASFENVDIPLIRKVAATGKPVILSTGLASLAELDETVRTLRENGCCDIVLLKCSSTYPATPDQSNIVTIPHMRELFECEVGLSDHTLGLGVSIASVAIGATVIERHFTLSRSDGGVDAAFSIEPNEMKSLVCETKSAWQALGHIRYGPTEKEEKSLKFRRSLYIVKDINAGDKLTKSNMRSLRPGFGLHPRFYDVVLGKKVNKSVKAGTAINWSLFG